MFVFGVKGHFWPGVYVDPGVSAARLQHNLKELQFLTLPHELYFSWSKVYGNLDHFRAQFLNISP